ncbi:hypothetical protein HER10_EVM0003837 [Colletotrichum scovillei]|uniref:Uncharacterized protein n=2 Tax=Colletotrichum acutatum species complex TaxID=2707335 RepID=A0A9P7RH71_9PEZI|nr:uncharacterized protein HER10_EVM0003837 [Colletotrichum scovillei]KXH59474.1 hypothetical protein CNYM01_12288 [Colletotrichum nymphaeae SA-01]KAF4779429.1 hypothetical protein HER10_EVM0003837 [Colletotrichum scovillei]KAG7058458.1 hypothetical protein JMJ77_0005834 [Colletotrichum scovillei]KAG7077001.1 hypothetical protein JMJ76_0014257 [Colletotrichum scovillei]KAG7084079.1 hypothetical protein JMJ78_0009519 [Colletotrichum scovillei]
MTSIESQQYLKAILRDKTDNSKTSNNKNNNSTMSGSFYESAFVIPHMQASAMPRRPRQPAPAPRATVGAMSSESTLVDKDGVPVMSKEKNEANGDISGSSSSSKNLLKRLLKKA